MLHASPHLVKQPRPIYKCQISTEFFAEGAQFTLSSSLAFSGIKTLLLVQLHGQLIADYLDSIAVSLFS